MIRNTPYVNKILSKYVDFYEDQEQKEREQYLKNQKQKNQIFITQNSVNLRKDLEQKLNEKQLHQLGAVAENKKTPNQTNQNQNETKQQTRNSQIAMGNYKKKTKICKQYYKTKLCRNKGQCIFAHTYSELDVEYQPSKWVKYFEEQQKKNEVIKRAQSSYNMRKPLYEPKKKITLEDLKQETKVYSIDKVIDKKGSTLLLQSVQQANEEAVRQLLMFGADPSIDDWQGCDSIMYAIKKNYYEVMCLLIDLSKYEVDFNKKFFTTKVTYLIMAAKLGLDDIVVFLLQSGCNPDIQDYYHKTALFYSVELNDIGSIHALVESGADATISDDYQKTPVDYAYEKKHLHIVTYLFEKKGRLADSTKHKNVLFFAAENNQMQLIRELINERQIPAPTLNDNGDTILLVAFKNQHYDLVKDLIETFKMIPNIAHKNQQDDSLITLSTKQGVLDLAKYLIQQCNVKELNNSDREGKTPLIYAAENGYHNLIEILMNKGVDYSKFDKQDKTALIYASKNNHLLCVEALLKQSLEENDVTRRNKQQLESQHKNAADQPKLQEKLKEDTKNRISKAKDMIHWQDQFDMTARRYAAKPSQIRNLISQHMIDQQTLSDSLQKELEDEEYQIDTYTKETQVTQNSIKQNNNSKIKNRQKQNFIIKQLKK